MQLKEIDHAQYRKRFKIVFTSIAIVLALLSLSLSTLFIGLFSTPELTHFYHNLAGLIVAAILVVFILTKLRQHPYLYEVVYVWDLKQQLNKIYRKQRNLKAAVEENNITAMNIMHFFYLGSKQLYVLDENTITMGSLISELTAHEKRMIDAHLSLDNPSYHQAMLEQF